MIIKQVNNGCSTESELLFFIIKNKIRTVSEQSTHDFIRENRISDLEDYLEVNRHIFNNFTFINKGDIDERTTRD